MTKFSNIKYFNLLLYFTLSFIILLLLPLTASAAAAGEDKVVQIMCNVIKYFNKIGKPIIIIVVIMVGTGLFFGKITWGLGITIVVAIAILLGAEDVVKFVTSGSGDSGVAICAEG